MIEISDDSRVYFWSLLQVTQATAALQWPNTLQKRVLKVARQWTSICQILWDGASKEGIEWSSRAGVSKPTATLNTALSFQGWFSDLAYYRACLQVNSCYRVTLRKVREWCCSKCSVSLLSTCVYLGPRHCSSAWHRCLWQCFFTQLSDVQAVLLGEDTPINILTFPWLVA